jgi:hypothetical protein
MGYLVRAFLALAVATTSSISFAIESYQLFERYGIERNQYARDLQKAGGKQVVAEKVKQRNLYELAGLDNRAADIRYPDRINIVSEELAGQLYAAVNTNPVASLSHYSKYDPQDLGIGFCFGRAMTAHLEALYLGISKDSIKKLWALGNLQTGSNRWRYHVTTVVKGEHGWVAIDPIMGSVLTIAQWYENMRGYDSDGQMRLYVTAAEKFAPSSKKYHNSELLDPYYNAYFVDLMKYYAERTRANRGRRALIFKVQPGTAPSNLELFY